MKTNIGSIDRILRVLIALAIAGLYFMDMISGTTAIILLVLAVVFVLTAFVGVCPIYLALGLSTKKKQA